MYDLAKSSLHSLMIVLWLFFLISDGQIFNATGSSVMFDESNSGDFFAELFKNDDAFQKRPMFRVIEILKNLYSKFVVNFNLFHADKPLAR